MNEHDAERIRALLEERGLAPVAEPDGADVLVYNTCTVRQSADDRLAGHLGTAARLKREDPGRIVLVTGCLPQAERDEFFRRFPFVDGAVGPQNLHHLGDLLEVAVEPFRRDDAHGPDLSDPAASEGPPRAYFEDGPAMSGDLAARRARPYQAWLQIMSGCTNYCSYCIVPYVRGPERSRSLADIVAETRDLVADGVREVTLLGQNVNAYGLDLAPHYDARGPREASASSQAPDFPALLRKLDAVEGLDRIRFMTSHPKDLSDELVAAVAESASVCEHVHLPAQAGSDRILAAMERGYTADWFLGRVGALREAVPDVSITTDLIVGFPGESEEEFAQTLDLVQAAAFDAAFTFVYSQRRGTAAADLPGQLAAEVKRERVERLIAATQGQALRSRRSWVGRRAEVLVEGASRDGSLLRGRSRQNVMVNVEGPTEAGAIVEVEVTAATSTTLRGTVATATSRR
jgi:tRNA-2-methylthio-N6-dimethylallyladenosine synthase